MFNSASILDRETTGLETIHIPDPAAGANLCWNIPEYTNILPISLSFVLSSDGTPSNRLVTVAGQRGGIAFCHAPAPAIMEANKIVDYHFAICVLGVDAYATNLYMTGCLSSACVLSYGEDLITMVDNLQAGDQISGVYLRYLQKMPR